MLIHCKLQHRSAHFVSNRPWRRNCRDSITNILLILKWSSLKEHRKQSCLMLLFKFINELIYIPSQYLPVLSPTTHTVQVSYNLNAFCVLRVPKNTHYQSSKCVWMKKMFMMLSAFLTRLNKWYGNDTWCMRVTTLWVSVTYCISSYNSPGIYFL